MKQLDLKATSSSTISIPFNPLKLFSFGYYWVVGKWRLYWNYCPECNSFAPKIHRCDVCNGNTKAYFDWNKGIAQRWWNKYLEKHHFQNY